MIVDVTGLQLTKVSDEVLVDQGVILRAALLYEFYDVDTEWKALCAKTPPDCDEMFDVEETLNTWFSNQIEGISLRFEFITAMRPYYPSDVVVMGDFVLIEMTEGED